MRVEGTRIEWLEMTPSVQGKLSARGSPSPGAPRTVAGRLFFSANDGTHGREIWTSDSTTAGTVFVKDIVPGSGSPSLDYLTALDAQLYFRADDGVAGVELWQSDGTATGTTIVADINAGSDAVIRPSSIVYRQQNQQWNSAWLY